MNDPATEAYVREVEPSSPPRLGYALTPLGRELAEHLRGLVHRITDHAAEIMSAQERHDTARHRY